MRSRPSFLVLTALFAICLLFAGPAFGAANRCVGGGRPRPDEGGIGGTGVQSMRPEDDGGIAGTGISARANTGIIGTVTGFGSVCVGGVEIQYAHDTPVRIDGQSATAGQLAVGQVVEVEAVGRGSEVSARQIAVGHVVSGPVTRVDVQHNQIDVIGQPVLLSPLTRAGDGAGEHAAVAAEFPLHAYLQVSGMRRADGLVVASRVSLGEPRPLVQAVGPITKVGAGIVWVAGTAVRIESRTPPAIGDEVRVEGRWNGSEIEAGSLESMPGVPFDGRVGRVDIEGFARRMTADRLQVGRFAVELSPAEAQEVGRLSPLDARVRIQAIVEGRHVIVQRVDVLDELPALPPLPPQKDVRGWNGGRPNDGRSAIGNAPVEQPVPGDHDGGAPVRDGVNISPGGAGVVVAPPPPEGNERPPAPQVPDRPPMPPAPDRPALPEVPERPSMPEIPDRPPRPERPPIPPRPDIPRRP